MDEEEERPVLTAVSSSARQLYLLLRCINFSDKVHVQITSSGLKFFVDEASVMEGSAFLDKSLFTTYTFHPPPLPVQEQNDSDSENELDPPDPNPVFQISLPSLLETLQILGLTDPNNNKPPWARDNPSSTAFSNNVLGMNNMCRISYTGFGAPLSIILTESTIRTTCDLTTYEPEFADEIPFDRQSLAFKTIMRGSWLSDAISELASTSPERLSLVAKMNKGKPFFALAASGDLGSASVAFNNNPTSSTRAPPPTHRGASPDADASTPANVLETFQLSDPDTPLRCTYKFALIQKAARAMSIATKVSVRTDIQGVLSLQFMIETEGAKVSFVDFRFVPLVEDDEGEGDTYLANDNEEDEDANGVDSATEDES
ncbi:Rad1-domain-containing protein [Aaosphaeria arxii CBS 175.79]|uniref:Rad1-domain-containing protein n=1 Tax=Aaosphaeria arxii CBS 175.79 TaxID=1450172 RepID=A0A6A5XWV0_9PLEO|nr:Rad1-domain-containing protein [Aaosphaeria arxii CBS 175.79]KAF2017632.1 Rad1-domain-containing protein [Aaosphaeria arxii CBS 175.79]